MPNYTVGELDDLEEAAESATPNQLAAALALISRIFEQNAITYAVLGGMNFYVRGSGRTTTDVDIAVDNRPRMDALLDILSAQVITYSVYRPTNRMQWVSGVARTFVDVGSRQMVQLDLMPKGAEFAVLPDDLAGSVDRLGVPTSDGGSFDCNMLAVGPLVGAKIRAHSAREEQKDYHDLLFVCRSAKYAPLVRDNARSYRQEWKECFLEKVIENDPEDEEQIRWALDTPRSPSLSQI
ncbi:hypothetical protein QBC46DRAFT_296196 [Diplogelasinospora grovesii]|uniref:Uncharacterized protein n=1 Tax=Diplogelasinospora grovesii TaxID=303347 RepID=A0AAN6MZX0_9PEZI|nr:hypothetical protein QBC46DRAFT_296196 [Diplogelasinospora grovesii]